VAEGVDDGAAVASTLLDPLPTGGVVVVDVDVAVTPGAAVAAFWVTAGLSKTTVWAAVGAWTAVPIEVVLASEVAEGPRVGKLGSAKACEAVPPWPGEGSPVLRPRLDATGVPNSTTTTRAPTATAPLMVLIAAVSLRRRRERLGLTGPCPPLSPGNRSRTAGT
jgi:uncharacterized protein (TIGR03382 family)